MLNIDLIDNLYAGLSKEQKDDLIIRLFKRSKQTMNYFRRTKDISMSKLEILADYFHMPLDYFRIESNFKFNNVNGSNNYVGNVSVGTNLLIENEALRKDNSRLQEMLDAKDKVIEAHEKTIKALESHISI